MKIPADSTLASSPALSSVSQGENPASFENSSGLLSRVWRWLRSLRIGQSAERRLRVADTVSLGEKRFVAVVQVDGRHFLLAGGPTNIALLAQLNDKEDFGEVLQKTMTVPAPAAAPVRVEEKPVKRRKKAVATAPATKPKKMKAAASSTKTSSAGMKKQPALAAKRSSKPTVPKGRFGDIPANSQGARAFEKWLGRTIPTSIARDTPAAVEANKHSQPAPEKVSAPGPLPLPPKQTLNEWLQESRPTAEKSAVHIAEQASQPTVEEYA